jgi:uncharacterized protein (TIGR02145 family)
MKKKLLIVAAAGLIAPMCAAQDLTVCASSSYTVPSASPAGSGATYMWLENGTEIPGATGEAYTNTGGKLTAGTYVYTRLAKTPTCSWQASNAFILWVVGVDSAPPITPPANKCSGEDIVFTVPAAAGTRYEWAGSGVAKDNTYTYPAATPGDKTVSVRAVAAVNGGMNCTSAYAGATATVYAMPAITAQPVAAEVCPGNTVSLSVTATDAAAYQWLKDGAPIPGNGNTAAYTTPVVTGDNVYKVVVGNAGACSVTSNEVTVGLKKSGCCDAPGVSTTFADFNPCAGVPTGSTWTLTDTREPTNRQSYKVKLLGDGRYWMVQDLKYGSGCNKNTFAGSRVNKTDNVAAGHYGDCRTSTIGGYLYDWAAAINKADAYYGSSKNVGCATAAAAATNCRGVCPPGWHVPSRAEFNDANNKFNSAYKCTQSACWNSGSEWAGVCAGFSSAFGDISEIGSKAYYWSSTQYNGSNAHSLTFTLRGSASTTGYTSKHFGLLVRCVRN